MITSNGMGRDGNSQNRTDGEKIRRETLMDK